MSIYRDRMTGYETWLFSYLKQPFSLKKPAWRNWQTRWTQNPVIARSCGFEPLRRQKLADFASKKALRTLLNTNILKLCSTERSLSAFFSQEDWFSPRTQHLLPFKVMF